MFVIEDYIKDFSLVEKPVAYKQWVSTYEEMIVHTRGVRPDKLIKTRRPYEAPDIQKYRLDNYEPITKKDIGNAINDLQRIFNGSNVKISMDDELKAYTQKSIFKKLNFNTYINKFVTRRMIEDPNGLLVWWVKGRADMLADAPELSNQKVDIEPILVLSKNIIHHTPEILTFMAGEKSDVTVAKGNNTVTVSEGKVYYMITKDTYYKYVQIGKKEEGIFELRTYYQHKLGEIPALVLGGYETSIINEKCNEEYPYFLSFFHCYVAPANEAIRQFSDHQAIMVTSGHPIREMDEIPCTNRLCKGGRVHTIKMLEGGGEKAEEIACGTCEGKGHLIPNSTYGVLIRPKEKNLGELGRGNVYRPALTYISPDVAIVKYAGEHWRALRDDAKDAVNQLFIQEAQSGVAKQVDRENKLATLDTIGINIFEGIVKYSLMIISKLRNITGSEISINLPASFRIKTELELIEEQTNLKSKGAAGILVSEVSTELLKKRFNGDDILQKIADVLPIYEPNFIYTPAEMNIMEAAGNVDYFEYQRWKNAHRVLKLLAYRKGKEVFLAMDLEVIMKEADEILKTLIPPEPTAVPVPGKSVSIA